MDLFTEFEGKWFLPDKEEEFLNGKLTVDHKSNIKLYLDGVLFKEKFPEFKETKYILGRTFHGELITLIDCIQIGHTESSFSRKTTFLCYTLLKGDHCHNENLTYKKAYIRTDFLNEFIDKRIFKSTFKNETTDRAITTETFEKEVLNYSNFKIYLRTYNSNSFTADKVVLERRSNIIVNFEQDEHEGMFIDKITHLIKFFSILANKELRAHGIVFYESKPTYFEHQFFSLKYRFLNSLVDTQKKYLLTLDEFDEEIHPILLKWYIDCEKINSLAILLIDSFDNVNGLLENKFLSLCKYLELFHKAYRSSLLNEEKDKFFLEVIEDCRESNKERLIGILNEKKHPSFNQRLSLLFQEAESFDLFKNNFLAEKDLIRKISKSRNYYTHYTKGQEELVLKGDTLLSCTQSLRTLCTYLLLKEVGLSESKLHKFFSGRKYVFS